MRMPHLLPPLLTINAPRSCSVPARAMPNR
jgi:hypothetical protein